MPIKPTERSAATIRVALDSFEGGVGLLVKKGDLYASDDPLVAKYPTLFGPVVVKSSVPVERIESATAAPGEKRGA
jgi:hypothetical protein